MDVKSIIEKIALKNFPLGPCVTCGRTLADHVQHDREAYFGEWQYADSNYFRRKRCETLLTELAAELGVITMPATCNAQVGMDSVEIIPLSCNTSL